MGKPSRDKGARGEREVTRLFRAFGFDCDRVPNSGGLFIPGDVAGIEGFHVEVKRCERLDVSGWLRQARDEAPDGATPLVVFRRSNEVWQAVLSFSALLQLMRVGDNA